MPDDNNKAVRRKRTFPLVSYGLLFIAALGLVQCSLPVLRERSGDHVPVFEMQNIEAAIDA
ncbi:MAG: hypothetical protein C0404_08375 [Verrucomicrobia bacterium]|nr:hypothetical protein [Verrucomicrobiota bacterium]